MNQNDLRSFAKLMAVIGEYYKPLSREVQEIYWQGLKRFSIQEIWGAFFKHISSSTKGMFRPLVANFIYYITPSSKTYALLAWAKVEKTIKEVGIYASVNFEDRIINTVILDLGGWIKLCRMQTKSMEFLIPRFIKLYEHYSEQPPTIWPKYLCGIVERENQIKNHEYPTPVLIRSANEVIKQNRLVVKNINFAKDIENVLQK